MSSRAFSVGTAALLLMACGGSEGSGLFHGSQGGASSSGAPAAGGASSGSGGSGAAGFASGGTTASGGTSGFGGAMTSGTGNGAGGGTLDTGGSTSAGGTGAGGADAGPCTDGEQTTCPCSTGDGKSTCAGGVYGPCACPACREGFQSPCKCPDGSDGTANCINGSLGGCLGCPIAASGCPVGMTCSASSSSPICGDATGLPPTCARDADCGSLQVACVPLPILGGRCLKSCTP